MDLLPVLLAFAAGFLTCLFMGVAAIWWSFSDGRVRESDPVIGNRHNVTVATQRNSELRRTQAVLSGDSN